MKRVFIIHRWEGGPEDDWRPWIKTELEQLGYQVFVPEMPDTDAPVIEKWVDRLAEVVGAPDLETYFIGHSIGCQTIMRYLETVNTEVGGALFVAGWFNLGNLEDEDTKEVAKPWMENPINLEKVKSVLPKSILLISKDDPYNCFEENLDKFNQIVTHASVLDSAGHFTESVEPEILEQFKNLT
jgi:hypothetical protein